MEKSDKKTRMDTQENVMEQVDRKPGNPYIPFGIEDQRLFQANIACIKNEIDWLSAIINSRLIEYRDGLSEMAEKTVIDIQPLEALLDCSYRDFINSMKSTYVDRLLIALAFAADYAPQIANRFLAEKTDTNYRPYGGTVNKSRDRFYPTLQTALFLLGGSNFNKTSYYKVMLTEKYPLFRERIISLHYANDVHDSYSDPQLALDPAYNQYFMTGRQPCLDYGPGFPAELLETEKTFDDLIVDESMMQDLSSIRSFIAHYRDLFSNADAKRKFAPGYVAMFYGPPGTGKSMTAALLGKHCSVPVYKIDLSRVISKYIGETEKNLELVFSRLEGKNVILFFDEADALFGKRTEITDAKDRYANQEVSYLLQRIEKWNGVVILATNYRQNLDEAFKRRIIKTIFFSPPNKSELIRLWQGHLPEGFSYASETLVEKLSVMYPFTGANIATILKKACIEALAGQTRTIDASILNPIIREECVQNNMNQQYRPL